MKISMETTSLSQVARFFLVLCFAWVSNDTQAQKTIIKKGSIVYRVENMNGSKGDIVEYVFTSDYKLSDAESIKVKEDHVQLSKSIFDNAKPSKTKKIEKAKEFAGVTDHRTKFQNTEKSYFYDPDISNDAKVVIKQTWLRKWKVTAVTITARNRSRVSKNAQTEIDEDQSLKNIPSTWETGFSPGLAFTKTISSRQKITSGGLKNQSLDKNTTQLDFGPLFSFGAQELSAKTTANRYQNSRKALTITVGGLVNLNINKFDFGIFGGIEFATGYKSTDWVYHGVPHWGFVLGYDLVKGK